MAALALGKEGLLHRPHTPRHGLWSKGQGPTLQ